MLAAIAVVVCGLTGSDPSPPPQVPDTADRPQFRSTERQYRYRLRDPFEALFHPDGRMALSRGVVMRGYW